MNPIRLTPEKSTYRTEPPSTGIADWSWQDCQHALAAGKASEIEAAAFAFRWHGGTQRHLIYGYLMAEAIKAEKRHRWSERLHGRKYLEPMVQLALDVEQNPRLDGLKPLVVPVGDGYQRFPGWWCLRLPWMAEGQWNRDGEPRYALIRQPLDIWVGEAFRKCRPFMREEEIGQIYD